MLSITPYHALGVLYYLALISSGSRATQAD